MENERPTQQALVKCVVVGDNAVGKTRLIVARACSVKVTKSQLTATHIPTVWAIDQYRLYPEIQERARVTVDGVEVSLRLWDTFGDHHKDRRFAYGRCDVVLVCFSIAKPPTLRHIKTVWLPEIRRFCPRTPIIMCGCQNDLRCANLDEINATRGLFTKPIYEKDIISPYDCRQVAKDIGATYYETSVVTMFGIRELFDNVIRAALISRRHTRFWISSLRKVQSPLLQEPYLPPKPEPPDLTLPPSSFCSDIGSLLDNPCCSDVVFLVKGILIPAHRVCLVAASPLFFDLFMMDLSAKIGDSTCKVEGVHPNMLDSIAGNNGIKSRDYKEEMSTVVMTTPGTSSWTTFTDSTPDLTAKLNLPLEGAASNIPASEVVRTPSSEDSIELLGACAPKILPSTSLFNEPSTSHCSVHSTAKFLGYPGKILDHPALASIHLQPVDNPVNGKPSIQTVVTVQQHISPVAFQVCLEYLYTGTFDQERWHNINLSELITVADALKLTSLVTLVTGVMNHDAYVNEIILKAQYMLGRTSRLRELILRKGLFSDMLIQTDDGTVASHRALLMARCDMMYAMLGGNFKESTCYEVFMPGTKHCFQALQEYLYTDQCPPMKPAECLCLIEMANFLCLPRLVALGEENIIREFNLALEKERDIQEDVINMLNVAQMHNAHQLHSWCLTFLARHFSDLHQEYMKSLRNVASEDARYLQRHRWPPTWYIKEKDYYDKEKREQDMSKRTTERKGKRKWCL